eukprot:7232840-Prymnesium_polylepis.3
MRRGHRLLDLAVGARHPCRSRQIHDAVCFALPTDLAEDVKQARLPVRRLNIPRRLDRVPTACAARNSSARLRKRRGRPIQRGTHDPPCRLRRGGAREACWQRRRSMAPVRRRGVTYH